MKTTKTIFLLCAVATIIFSDMTLATESDQTKPQDKSARRQGPPPEAYTACEGKSAGDSAVFVNPRGETFTGTCEQENDRLVLRPDNRPVKRNDEAKQQGPPPEAYLACEGKNIGDEAQFVSPRGETMVGTCEQEGDKLVLRPNRSKENSE